jgi:hypothetical protein
MNTPASAIGTMPEEVPTTDEIVASQHRRFVTWAVDEFRWPHYTATDLAVVNRVLNEDDVSPLSYLHELLLAAKLIRHAKTHVLLTKTGRCLKRNG